MLGLFPASLLLLLSFAIIYFSVRILFVCCRSIFNFIPIKSCDSTPLFNACKNTDSDMEEYLVN